MNKIFAALALSSSFLAAGLASAAVPTQAAADVKEAGTDAKAVAKTKRQQHQHSAHKGRHTTPKKTLG